MDQAKTARFYGLQRLAKVSDKDSRHELVKKQQFSNRDKICDEKFIFQFSTNINFVLAVDIINSSSTESNEYDIRYDEDLLSNEIYTSPYNAGTQLTRTCISFLSGIVTYLLL